MTDRIGTKIAGRYRLDELLGDGSTADVFRATDLQLGREVAVKLLRTVDDPDVAARFEREARVGAALEHPHVVQTLDFGAADGVVYLVTALVSGGDLHRYHRAHMPMTTEQVLQIGLQIAEALSAAHEIGLVHRDLKPENILVDEGPHVRIADFGLAFLTGALDPREGRLTQNGTVSGTPMYMSPEQVNDGTLGPAVDVYALGCVLYELLVDTPPFVGAYGKIFADHLYGPVPSPRAVRSTIPGGLDELVVRMMSKSPLDRPTIEIVARRLAALSSNADSPMRAHDVRSNRAERQLTLPPVTSENPTVRVSVTRPRIALWGTPPADLLTALNAGGIDVVPLDEKVAAILAFGAEVADLVELLARCVPVIADAAAKDLSRVTSLIKLGVTDVVMQPVSGASVLTKLRRAITKRTEHA